MKKQILGLLLAICLVIGLLPVVALADTTTAKISLLSSLELSVTEGGTPAYAKNKEFNTYNKADGSSTFKGWTQEKGSKDNWNVKFEWPKGGTPTVTLKDAKFDYYDNETQTYAYIKQADGKYVSTANRTTSDLERGGDTEYNRLVSAIMPVKGCHIDLKVVLEGENFVETGSGFVFGDLDVKANSDEISSKALEDYYFKNLTFTSVGEGKVVANGGGIGIMCKSGYNITFEKANIEISNNTHGSNACPIHATNGSITFNGGKYKISNPWNPAVWATGDDGNITINDGDFEVSHKLTSTAGASTFYPKDGTLTINGGNIVGTSDNAPILNAGTATIINGGNIKATSAYYAIYAGATSLVQINGGTVEAIGEHAYNFRVFLGKDVIGAAGANRDNCEVYDPTGNMYMKPWVLLSSEEGVIPTGIDTAPTEPSEEPTTPATSAPTTEPVVYPTIGAQDADDTAEKDDNTTLLVIIAAAVLVVAGAAVAVIVIKRKKA